MFYKKYFFFVRELAWCPLKPFGYVNLQLHVFNRSCAYLGTLLHTTVPVHPITMVDLIVPQDHGSTLAVPWYQATIVTWMIVIVTVLVLVCAAVVLCRMRVRSGSRCMFCSS